MYIHHTCTYTHTHTHSHCIQEYHDTQLQLNVSDSAQQPPALSSDLPKLDISPQPLEFSKDMNCDELTVWLTNHPLFVRADHQEDINKLKGI